MQEPIIYYRDITKGVKEEIKIAAKYFKTVNQRTLTRNNLVIPRYSMIPNGKELEKDLKYPDENFFVPFSELQKITGTKNNKIETIATYLKTQYSNVEITFGLLNYWN